MVLDGHGRDVLPAIADDQLLESAGDLHHARLQDDSSAQGFLRATEYPEQTYCQLYG